MGTGAVGGNVDGGMDDVPEVKTGGTGDGAFGGTGGDDFVAAISGDGDEEDTHARMRDRFAVASQREA